MAPLVQWKQDRDCLIFSVCWKVGVNLSRSCFSEVIIINNLKSRGSYKAGMWTSHLSADSRSVHDLLTLFTTSSATAAAHFTPVTPETTVNFTPKENILNSWNWQFDGGFGGWKDENTEHIQWCQERKRHVLRLMFGNRAEALMEGWGAGARFTDPFIFTICQVNMFQHRADVTFLPTQSDAISCCCWVI